jgi:tetratricopeptide (TPR) repeat protein
MRDPSEEAALLEAMLDFMAPCEALVTFNGKAFDAPLLTTRYTLHSIPTPFRNFTHVDLLPLARRLWRDRLPSRALKYLEEHVMFAPRTSEEVPGYEIPFLYFDFLRTGDAAPLKGVFYHNAMDIVAMTALFSHTASMLADPHSADLEHGLDVAALAKLFEDMGKWDDAARLYERGLQIGLPEAGFAETLRRYSALQRRRGNVESAVKLWEQAAGEGHVYAHVELSKHHEHRKRDISEAFRWARSALELAQAPSLPPSIRKYWTEEITHRLARLEKKFNSPKESYP